MSSQRIEESEVDDSKTPDSVPSTTVLGNVELFQLRIRAGETPAQARKGLSIPEEVYEEEAAQFQERLLQKTSSPMDLFLATLSDPTHLKWVEKAARMEKERKDKDTKDVLKKMRKEKEKQKEKRKRRKERKRKHSKSSDTSDSDTSSSSSSNSTSESSTSSTCSSSDSASSSSDSDSSPSSSVSTSSDTCRSRKRSRRRKARSSRSKRRRDRERTKRHKKKKRLDPTDMGLSVGKMASISKTLASSKTLQEGGVAFPHAKAGKADDLRKRTDDACFASEVALTSFLQKAADDESDPDKRKKLQKAFKLAGASVTGRNLLRERAKDEAFRVLDGGGRPRIPKKYGDPGVDPESTAAGPAAAVSQPHAPRAHTAPSTPRPPGTSPGRFFRQGGAGRSSAPHPKKQ